MSLTKNKNSVQKLVIYLSLAVFITANVGMAVYTHTCSISGTEKSLFLSYEDPCGGGDHEELTQQKKSCCAKETAETEAEDQAHIEKSCCSTDTDYVALDIDTRIDNNHIQFVWSPVWIDPSTLSPVVYFSPEISFTSRQIPEHYNLPPPKYQGRDFQSIHQVYLI